MKINDTHLSHGMILTSSNTFPVPSAFLAQTGWLNGWKVRAQQSKGVRAPGCGASCFLHEQLMLCGSLNNLKGPTPCVLRRMRYADRTSQNAQRG